MRDVVASLLAAGASVMLLYVAFVDESYSHYHRGQRVGVASCRVASGMALGPPWVARLF
jgi:hypothetical protein